MLFEREKTLFFLIRDGRRMIDKERKSMFK